MADIIVFIIHHWVLTSFFVMLALAVCFMEIRERRGGPKRLVVSQLVQMMNHENALIVDIRDRQSYGKGHIIGSVHLLSSEISPEQKILTKHRENPIVFVCASGTQSASCATKLIQQGFEKVYYLSGGMQSWQQDNMPLVK